jgi:hypothetical protein
VDDASNPSKNAQKSSPTTSNNIAATNNATATNSVATAGAGIMPWASTSENAPYGYDKPNYAWLRGKLEYSQTDQQWKLRYIPVESDNDSFGGSVILSNAANMKGYQPGDFVEVRGRVQTQQPQKGYAPVYDATEVKPIRKAS